MSDFIDSVVMRLDGLLGTVDYLLDAALADGDAGNGLTIVLNGSPAVPMDGAKFNDRRRESRTKADTLRVRNDGFADFVAAGTPSVVKNDMLNNGLDDRQGNVLVNIEEFRFFQTITAASTACR